MSLSVRFLGTSAARPTVERGVSSLAVVREGDTFLVDCGEGTQRQMMRWGVSFTFRDVLFTHFHADHFLGLAGLVRTMALQGRTEPLRCWGPRGAKRVLKQVETIGIDRLAFPLEVTEVAPGDVAIRGKGFTVAAFASEHRGTPAVGWAFVEEERRGRFNPDLARELGVPEGPLWGKLHKGEVVTLEDGTVVDPAVLVGPTRPGRTVVITGDTRPCASTVEIARDADLLVHEATFAEEEAARAVETGHSTAKEAACVALEAGCRRLVLTHFSARYSRDASDLEREARMIFKATTCAKDGMEVEVGFRDAG